MPAAGGTTGDPTPPRPWESTGLTPSEWARKIVHIGVGGFAFLLRYLTWREAALMAVAAFLFNWQLLPRIGGRDIWRALDREKGYPLGILLYPLSVLGLILAFRHEIWMAAAVWGILAVGDGAASIAGQGLGGPRLPWNPRKGWAGFIAFVVFGTLASAVLAAWTLGLPLSAAGSHRILTLMVPLALFCALVESAPTSLDDNLTVPLAGAILLPLLAQGELHYLAENPALPRLLLLGAVVNGAIAALARLAGAIDTAGALSAVIIGTAITVGLNLHGLALMVAFFVVGTVATRLGYRVKAAQGIAQEKGGSRGWRNAWANGGVPALLALLAGSAASDPYAPGFASASSILFTIAYASAVATAAADTCSSEIGKAYGRRTRLITTLRPVPPGTEGAVSLEGTLAGLAGACVVAAVGAQAGLYPWRIALLVSIAGLLGSLVESVVGTVAERKGWMGNDLLNAFNTAVGAGIGVLLVRIDKPPLTHLFTMIGRLAGCDLPS